MEDTAALPLLIHCSGPFCVDEIAQPSTHFWKCHVKQFRSRPRPMYCRRCWFVLKFKRTHDLPTHWDLELARLGLAGKETAWPQSRELRRWAERHASHWFVPEKLLTTWRIPVRIDF